MRITALRARVVRIPRRNTLTTSYGTEDNATTVLVELDTDEGLCGFGQVSVDAPFYGESADGILTNVLTHIGPALAGQDPMDITRLNAVMRATLPNHWFSHSAVEMALWDLKGKALGAPVYDLLGGRVRPGLSLMGFVRHDTPANMAAIAKEQLDAHGYPVLKMKIGLDPTEDVERYRAVSEAVADRAVIQVDGNTGYTLSQAIPALATMESIGRLGAVEQPVARLEDMADLARRLHTPVMADESIYPPEDAIDVVRRKAASIALMKLGKHGGIHNVTRIGAIFEAAGLALSIAIYYDLIGIAAAHLAAALPTVTWPSPDTELSDSILASPYVHEGLLIRAPSGPGLGVELDWDKVEHYTVDV